MILDIVSFYLLIIACLLLRWPKRAPTTKIPVKIGLKFIGFLDFIERGIRQFIASLKHARVLLGPHLNSFV